MIKVKLIIPIFLFAFACNNDEDFEKADKMLLLSGGDVTGKKWQMVSFVSTSNYYTLDVNKFQETDIWLNYPASIKDNITTIFPNGESEINEGEIPYNAESPQVYNDLQHWHLNENQDSVTITDYVGLPSIHDTWALFVSEDKIVLTREELDLYFEGSSLTQEVTFETIR